MRISCSRASFLLRAKGIGLLLINKDFCFIQICLCDIAVETLSFRSRPKSLRRVNSFSLCWYCKSRLLFKLFFLAPFHKPLERQQKIVIIRAVFATKNQMQNKNEVFIRAQVLDSSAAINEDCEGNIIMFSSTSLRRTFYRWSNKTCSTVWETKIRFLLFISRSRVPSFSIFQNQKN